MANQCIFLLLNKYEHSFSYLVTVCRTWHPRCRWTSQRWGSWAWTQLCRSRRGSSPCPTLWPQRRRSRANLSQVGRLSRLRRFFVSLGPEVAVGFIHLCFEKGCKNHFSPPAERKHTHNCYICQNRYRHSGKFFSRHQIYIFWLEEG